jgi:LacI family transcriptional regulator
METAGADRTRVTIGDVAERAGVSIATVSRVVNERYGVADATILKVQKVIDELGYEASLVARSLRNQRTNVVGILVAGIEPFSAELLKGAARALQDTSYELVVYSGGMHGEAGWERRYLSRLSGTLTDGVILVTPTVDDVGEAGLIVTVDPHSGSSGLPNVHADNLVGAITATEYLIGLGHRRIGFLGGRPDLQSARMREQGYHEALATAGIDVDPDLVRVGGYELNTSVEPARQLLDRIDPPTAIFAANDLSAIETMIVARSIGLSVPEDVSVIGFDNIPESALTDPPLTTIDQSIQTMGEEAVHLLVDLLKGVMDRPHHVVLPTKLVERQSCRRLGRVG